MLRNHSGEIAVWFQPPRKWEQHAGGVALGGLLGEQIALEGEGKAHCAAPRGEVRAEQPAPL